MNKQKIEKAIEDLKYIQEKYWETSTYAEFDEAISAIEHQLTNGWIPAPPLMGTECLVQTVNDEIIHAYYAGDCKYYFAYYYGREVLAQVRYWQPLPEPYKEDTDAGNIKEN